MASAWLIVGLAILDFVSGTYLFLFWPHYVISGEAALTGLFLIAGGGMAKPFLMVGVSLLVSGLVLTLYIATTGLVLQ